jgi:predicted dithiol-disulfide oxidoreductase (DUF899 family)
MLPAVVDRTKWQARVEQLRVKEKAHTRAGDALAAERRCLPMVEVDPTTKLIGADGPVPLIDIFVVRRCAGRRSVRGLHEARIKAGRDDDLGNGSR